MRPFGLIRRRDFLARLSSAVGALAVGWFKSPGRAWADADYFSGTDFVGKTRAGRYEKFYVNYWRSFQRIRAEAWTLDVGGLCEAPRRFGLEELKTLPAVTQTSRLKCVECWSARAEWRGFRVSELEKLVRPHPDAAGILFHCGDDYVEYLDRESLNNGRALLAYAMDGEPLTHEHGFPLRAVVPFKYGYKNPKAILRMEYVAQRDAGLSAASAQARGGAVRGDAPPFPGTWSKIGPYSIDGTILPGYDHPLDKGKIRRRIYGGEIFD